MSTYSVPKQNDFEVCQTLNRIRAKLKSNGRKYTISAIPERGSGIEVPEEIAPEHPPLKHYFDLKGGSIKSFQFTDKTVDGLVLIYDRRPDKLTDGVTMRDDWINQSSHNRQGDVAPSLAAIHAAVQSEFKVDELTASLVGTEDSEWNRYREAQTAILHDLSAATKRLFEESAREISRVREAESKKGEELRVKLETQVAAERELLHAEIAREKEELSALEDAHKQRVADFETREGRYVARQQTKAQLDQLKAWLTDSSLTENVIGHVKTSHFGPGQNQPP